jgi:hypothetical protein
MQVTEVQDADARAQLERHNRAVKAIDPDSGAPPRQIIFSWITPEGRLHPNGPTYVQDQLGMFPSQEFALLIKNILRKYVDGEMGKQIGQLFQGNASVPTEFTPDAVNKAVDENMAVIQAIFQLIEDVPGLQQDIICLSLGIPNRERPWAKEAMTAAPYRGGLTVDEGFDLLITFIKQNAELVRETYVGNARELVEVFRLEVLGQTDQDQEETEETPTSTPASTPDSPGGTPSSTSAPFTPASA